MNLRSISLSLAAIALLAVPSRAADTDLDKVLRQMDAASASFQSAQADFKWDLYERVVKETTSQSGTISFLRKASLTQMAAHILKPSEKTLVYKDGGLQIYESRIDQLTLLSAGKNQAQYESFLTLGFGGSGKDLASAWTITYGGEETIDGVHTAKLDLVSKQQSVRDMFSHITVWIDPARGISLRQHFYTPSGDERTAFYTNVHSPAKIDPKVFVIATTKKTVVKRP